MARSDDEDGWYASEPRWGTSLVLELRRLQRRAAARPFLTLGIAIFLTAFLVNKFGRKPHAAIAHIVIAVSDGSLASGRDPIPVSQMQEYANSALMPNDKLAKMIEEMNLFPARKRLGMPFALGELRDMIEVRAYRNYFAADSFSDRVTRTARIEITAGAADPDLAFDVAEHIAELIVSTSDEIQDDAADKLTRSVDAVLTSARADASDLDHTIAIGERNLRDAERLGETSHASALRAELALLDVQERDAQRKLETLEAGAARDRATASAMAAGLDLKLEVVSQRKPLPDAGSGVRVIILAIIAFIVILPATGIVIGAFDPRIHDAGDVTRLGFASLGHVPAYAGDRIGSLRARGIRRRRAAQF